MSRREKSQLKKIDIPFYFDKIKSMVNKTTNNSIIISKRTIRKEGGLVILPLREYEELRERAVPTYYLEGKEAEELDKLVEEGLKDYRKGRCKSIKSLSDLD